MKEKSGSRGAETLKNKVEDKTNELVNAIKKGVIFEKTRKIYLEMKALKERLVNRLNNNAL